LEKKIEVLKHQREYVQNRIATLDAAADQISQLERTRKLQAQNYEQYETALENARIKAAFGNGKASNIDIIQNPRSPVLDNSKMSKVMGGLAFVGIALGLGLAFLIELYIDRSLKRPADIESRLGVPLFLSIPYRNGTSKRLLLKEPPKTVLALHSEATGRTFILNGGKTTIGRDPENTVPMDDESISKHHCEIVSRNGEVIVKDLGSAVGTFVNGERIVEATLKADMTLRIGKVEFSVQNQEMAKDLVLASKGGMGTTPPWDPRHPLRPFYDTLRDRLITYFEVKNLTHNPKLVALTSCSDRAGVTSTAAGLAAALSETGEGNVLLVDMNVERGAAHHFYKGHLSCGIDEALKQDKRKQAQVQENLYVVTESQTQSDDLLPRMLPKRFNSLVSQLKASDFDYIIFDMPPMSQISITPRLAKFMDMVMMVVESEKTDRDVVQRAVNMLTETKANVSVVLNKRKNYVPQKLQQEL
jgi:Mrp family chromosome partitioning ATPase